MLTLYLATKNFSKTVDDGTKGNQHELDMCSLNWKWLNIDADIAVPIQKRYRIGKN